MIITQNILVILRTFSNLPKSFMKHFTPRRQLPKLLPLNFLAKFLKERKYLINNLTFVRQNYLYRPGQIARPMPIGRARMRETSEARPTFQACTFYLVKKEKFI